MTATDDPRNAEGGIATVSQRAAATGRDQYAALAVQGFDGETSLAGTAPDPGGKPELTMTSVIVRARSNEPALTVVPAATTITVGVLAWWATGYAVAAPVAAVGIVSVAAGVFDARIRRIPNRLVTVALVAFAIGAVLTAIVDGRPAGEVAGGALLGLLLSGAPLLALMWVLRPAAIGGGDVKLLTVQAATIGLLAPLAAPLILVGAAFGSIGLAAAHRQRSDLPLGPGLAAGFAAAAIVGSIANVLLGGTYQ